MKCGLWSETSRVKRSNGDYGLGSRGAGAYRSWIQYGLGVRKVQLIKGKLVTFYIGIYGVLIYLLSGVNVTRIGVANKRT